MFKFWKSTEEKLRARLLAGDASLQEGLALYESTINRGEKFPLDLEEAVLKLGLKSEPHRLDLLARLRYVLTAQEKTVPPHVEIAFAEHASKQERDQDHQRAASEYNSRSELMDMDQSFVNIYERYKKYSMTSVERMYAMYQAIRYIENSKIEGAIVECGVWRGGSMMIAASTLLENDSCHRELYLFDTYEGLPRPDEKKDIDIWGNRAIDGWLPYSINEEKSHWAQASEDEVKSNLLSTGYPQSHLHFIKGMVERTIPIHAPEKIALLRLDTDWYESTKHELEHLYDRLAKNGVLIIDDYGHFKGARQAVDEFFVSRGISVLLNRIDYSGRLLIKTK